MSQCTACQKEFFITTEDYALLERLTPIIADAAFAIPAPTHCPDCRRQRRLSFRNDRQLHKRTCSFSKKPLLSVYRPDTPFPVYSQEIWWSDKWNAQDYARDLDLSRSFFEQFHELIKKVPRASISISNCEDCQYTNQIADSKNCYLLFSATGDIHCYYSYRLIGCEYSTDCLMTDHSSQCYEVINSNNCHRSSWLLGCDTCNDSRFLEDCQSCTDCLFCVGLTHASYCIWNVQYSPEEYAQKKAAFNFANHEEVQGYISLFRDFVATQTARGPRLRNADGCTGNYLQDCHNSWEIYDATNCDNARYGHYLHTGTDIMDMDYVYGTTHSYEVSTSGLGATNIYFSIDAWPGVNNLFYCDSTTQSSKDCFGCVGLRGAQYCILNKQYEEAEYKRLVTLLITRMRQTGEWGEFFPLALSPFPYNDSVAQEYFPITREQALSRNVPWQEDVATHIPAETFVPANDSRIYTEATKAQELLGGVLQCTITGKPYRIIPQELSLYLQLGVPVPRLHPDQRHKERLIRKEHIFPQH